MSTIPKIDILSSFNFLTQGPLDYKNYFNTDNDLKTFIENNGVFSFYEGQIIYVRETNKFWQWMDMSLYPQEIPFLTLSYTYPPNYTNEIYANRSFGFFDAMLNIPTGLDGEDGNEIELRVDSGFIQWRYITTPSSSWVNLIALNTLEGPIGPQGENADNLQKTITTNYTLLESDNNHTMVVNNGGSNINIIVPTGLSENWCVGFIQKGTGDVSIVADSGVTVLSSLGFKIKGQYNHAYLEKEGNTNTFYLIGNTKV